MAIAYRNHQTSVSAAGGTSHVFTMASGILSGDVLLLAVTTNGTPTHTTPAGWTLANMQAVLTNVRTSIFWKVAGASEGNVTVTISGSANCQGGIIGYSGVDNTTPLDVTPTSQESASSTTITAPSITPTSAGTWIVRVFAINVGAGTTFTTASGHTERYEAQSSSATKRPQALDDIAGPGAGVASGTTTSTAGTAGANSGQTIALRPAGGGAAATSLLIPTETVQRILMRR